MMSSSLIQHILKKMIVGISSVSIGLLPIVQTQAADYNTYQPGDFELQPVYYKSVPQTIVNEVMVEVPLQVSTIEVAETQPTNTNDKAILPLIFFGTANLGALIIFSLQALSRWENLGESPLLRDGGCRYLHGSERYDCDIKAFTFAGMAVMSMWLVAGIIFSCCCKIRRSSEA